MVAFKLYPAGATTNSASGVTDIQRVIPTMHAMAEVPTHPVFSIPSPDVNNQHLRHQPEAATRDWRPEGIHAEHTRLISRRQGCCCWCMGR